MTRETGIHYSNNPVVLLAEKKEFEGSESTTRMIRQHCWPKGNNSRDQNPQLE
jgi:hypothetical protein